MSARKAGVVGAWLCALAAAAWIAAHARYVTDLSAFLPSHPTPEQRLLIDQLREGPASRLMLIGIEGADSAQRAALSRALAGRLRADPQFASIGNGEEANAERDREFLFAHRYLLSDAVEPRRFTAAGLAGALEETVDDLASPEGLFLKPLVPHDPTGETLRIIDRLARIPAPHSQDGVWVSPDGARSVLVAETAAAGADTDAQERALRAIHTAFDAASLAAPHARLIVSGPGVFAVEARAHIERAAIRLSVASSVLIVLILLAVYRSIAALVLGLLPVATGALLGVAAVALGFGAVHGITLGFGVTLIGESVDYSVYFFIQSLRRGERWQHTLWPTMRLGMLTSVCGFASLLPSGFPGLAQLGAYSISGLVAAAAVTRFVLPELLPQRLAIRDLTPVGFSIVRALAPAGATGARYLAAALLALVSLILLARAHGVIWDRELASLSPIPAAAQREDALLRADLGAPDALDLVVVSGPDLESVLRDAERTAAALEPLIAAKVIGGFDSPTNYLPSLASQSARRDALPDPATLRENLDRATAGLALDRGQLAPFLEDVEAARHAPLLGVRDLADTSFAVGFDAMVMHGSSGWRALLPLRTAPQMPDIDGVRVSAALAAAGLGADARLLDPKQESDALYDEYLHEALRYSLAGLVAIVVLLSVALRSLARMLRVMAPLVLAVLCVAAGLVLCNVKLTILHLVGMLLIVAVGSNYALFFDRRVGREAGDETLTWASLALANLCTVLGFGLLSFSGVPVLEALGSTVAPGALLALLFAALLTRRGPASDA
jgi:predicted exporter